MATGGRDGGRRRGPGGNAALRGFGFGTVALVLLGVWALTGVYQVDAAERGVVTRFGQYVRPTEPGLRWHMPWPIEARQIVNVETIEGVSDQTRMLTADENLVDINIAVQYRRADPVAVRCSTCAIRKQTLKRSERERHPRDRRPQPARLRARARGARRSRPSTKELIQRTLDSYKTGIEVDHRQPAGRQRAGAGAELAARCDQGARGPGAPGARGAGLRQRHPAEGQGLGRAPDRGREAYKARIVADAEGEAARFTKLLAAYAARAGRDAPAPVLRDDRGRCCGNTNKVLVDTKGTGNMIYLPLDKLIEGRARTLTLDEQRQSRPPCSRRASRQPPRSPPPRSTRGASGGPADEQQSYLPLLILGAAAMLLSMAAFTVRETEARDQVAFRRDRRATTTSRACTS